MADPMNALVYEGSRQLELRRVPMPVPAADEVLIRVERVGICGSELSGYLGHNSLRKPPLVMGHEFAGVVETAGSGAGAAGFAAGDRVTANPLVSCGACRLCVTGKAQLCPDRKLLGAHVPGAFADYVAVPVRNVFRLPESTTFEEGAFAEPLACAVHAIRLLAPQPGERLLIAGAGPIGLFALQAARLFGADDITVTDVQPDRLAVVRELGGAPSLPGDVRGRFDAAVDAVGMEATRVQCVERTAAGGRVVLSGLHEADSRLPVNAAIRGELRLQGAFAYAPADFADALRWLGEGKARMGEWTETLPLRRGRDGFEALLSGAGGPAKIILRPER